MFQRWHKVSERRTAVDDEDGIDANARAPESRSRFSLLLLQPGIKHILRRKTRSANTDSSAKPTSPVGRRALLHAEEDEGDGGNPGEDNDNAQRDGSAQRVRRHHEHGNRSAHRAA